MNVEPIINVRFKKFKDSYDVNSSDEGSNFERFVNHAILSTHQPDAFSADEELLDKVCVGGPNDMSIDGLAIKLNGLFMKSINDIDDIIEKFKRASVEFIFIQSKHSPKFNTGEFNNFVSGVRDFLNEDHLQPMNDRIKSFLEMKEHLLDENTVIMWENNPSVRLYYVTMGKWNDSPHQIALAEQLKKDLGESYVEPVIHFIDSESLKKICDSNENKFDASINTIDTMPLTHVEGVDNSCIALCYADEFTKLIITDDKIIRKSLFEDNVRDYQGMNSVNSEIEQTIKNDPEKFIILNNGITIVCDEYKPSNRTITMKNPQIVNGCQTSHVIHQVFIKGIDVSKIPLNIKIISTKNLDVINQIVRGTNRQNIVYDEAFETTKKFHKDLEEFFDAYPQSIVKIYYERRSKQYNHDPRIKQIQKINLRILTQSFIAMFLDKPHIAHRHESKLLKEFSNSIFQEQHSRLPYFVAALTFYLLESYFRNNPLKKTGLYTYRSQLLTLIREFTSGPPPNLYSDKESDKYCQSLLQTLNSENMFQNILKSSFEHFNDSKTHWTDNLHKSIHSIKDNPEFTKVMLDKVRLLKENIHEKVEEKFRGKVIKIIIDRYGKYCGFIERNPNNIFFHSNKSENLEFTNLQGKYVYYLVETNKKNKMLVAVSVTLG
ncbi:MAG: AIPR family protein [Nitrospirae bacterium]|nr:AIPR family protein [Nitrospirota bacterium]